MKQHQLLAPCFFALSMFFILPLQASHLDGLWHNDIQHITLRIEQEQDGFKAKRIDQGIWYSYSTHDNRHFTDRRGNQYELVSDNQLIWYEAGTYKKLIFIRVDSGNENRWKNNGDNYDRYSYDNGGYWKNGGYDVHRNNLEGRWYGRNASYEYQITSFDHGIKVKSDHNGWEKFYADRLGNRFTDKHGNSIMVIDRETLRYQRENMRDERILTRHRNRIHEYHNRRN